MRLIQMGFHAQVVGEPTTPAITKDDILFSCSASGETPMLVEHAHKAQKVGAKVIVITADARSTLAEFCSHCMIVKASTKQKETTLSIQPMGSLFEQSLCVLFDIVVLLLMHRYGISSEEMYRNHSNLE